MPISLDVLASRLDELPPLSDTPQRLSEAIDSPSCSVDMLARVIERDATLAQRVLKLANSAFYAVPGGVDSTKRAVTFVGFSTVHQLALYVSSMAILNQSRPIPSWLMQHASAVASLSRYLAKELKLARRDAAFSAGLLHDLGWLALHALFPDECAWYANEVRGGAPRGLKLEEQVLGVNHEDVGARLAARWKFPPALVLLVSDHHGAGSPKGSPHDPVQQLCDVVAVADGWAWARGRPGLAPPQRNEAAIDPARLERLAMTAPLTSDQEKAVAEALKQDSMFA